jgi:hypothetical protein
MSSQLITLPCSKEIYDWVMESPDMTRHPAQDMTVAPFQMGEGVYGIMVATTGYHPGQAWIIEQIEAAMRDEDAAPPRATGDGTRGDTRSADEGGEG